MCLSVCLSVFCTLSRVGVVDRGGWVSEAAAPAAQAALGGTDCACCLDGAHGREGGQIIHQGAQDLCMFSISIEVTPIPSLRRSWTLT